MEPPDDLALGESASNTGSTSSIRSQMAKVLADKAALLARRRHAPKKQQLQIQQAQMQAQMHAQMLHMQHEVDAVDLDAELDATVQREQVLKGELAAESGLPPINAPLFSTPQAGAVGGVLNPMAAAGMYPSPEYTALAATTIADQSVVLFPPIANLDLNVTSSAASVTSSVRAAEGALSVSAPAFVPTTSIQTVQAPQQKAHVSASLGAIPRRASVLPAVTASASTTRIATAVSTAVTSTTAASSIAVSTGSIPSVFVQPPLSRHQQPASSAQVSTAPYTLPPPLNPTPAPANANNISSVVPPIYISVPPQQAPVVHSNFDQIASLITSTTLPKTEIVPFDSDPKTYTAFITNFKINIENKVLNNSQRLNYLIFYCQGESKDLIKIVYC